MTTTFGGLNTVLVDMVTVAVANRERELINLTRDLTQFPSTRGNEGEAQNFVAAELERRGLEVDRVPIDLERIQSLPGFSPTTVSYSGMENIVGTWTSQTQKGRSLILNGHIDVVPEGPLDRWTTPPYIPRVEGGWIYGRGAGDMKAGIATMIVALDVLADIGFRPAADVFVQSVLEEECTGNGALACLAAGYDADAAIIPEPVDEHLVSAQVGVIWFKVRIEGAPAHVLEASSGSNAIEACLPLVDALHGLEARWNAPDRRPAAFADIERALTLNIGKISGGDWASSVPSWCEMDVRMGVFPGQSMDEATQDIVDTIELAAIQNGGDPRNLPVVSFNGFLAEGYALEDDESSLATVAADCLGRAFARGTNNELVHSTMLGTTDARFFGLYGGIPSMVFGPRAKRIHGFDEAVEVASMVRVCTTIALFIAEWCGLEPLD